MFNKPKKQPEDMTDAEMSDRLVLLRGTIDRVNKYALRIFGGVVGAAGVTGAAVLLLMSAPAAPLAAISAIVGMAAVSLVVVSGQRSECQDEIFILSEENKYRITKEKARQKAAAALAVKAMSQSTFNLREAFDAAIDAMGKGLENKMSVRRPLRLKTNVPSDTP